MRDALKHCLETVTRWKQHAVQRAPWENFSSSANLAGIDGYSFQGEHVLIDKIYEMIRAHPREAAVLIEITKELRDFEAGGDKE